jgi:hypothetical protein
VFLFGVLIVLVIWPRALHAVLRTVIGFVGRRSAKVAARLHHLEQGIDEARDAMAKFSSPRGWLALLWATIISGPSHANKLLSATWRSGPSASRPPSSTCCCFRL